MAPTLTFSDDILPLVLVIFIFVDSSPSLGAYYRPFTLQRSQRRFNTPELPRCRFSVNRTLAIFTLARRRNSMRQLPRLLVGCGSVVLASLLLAAPVAAQVTTADITGRVLDQNGAAVSSATITARNTGTGQERTVQSDQNGNYTLAALLPGTYDISV